VELTAFDLDHPMDQQPFGPASFEFV